MAILDTVRLALRWKSTSLDTEIQRYIDWSRAEIERAGVSQAIASSDNTLITDCIVQGCLMNLSTDERIRDAAGKSFQYQLDNLRKSARIPGSGQTPGEVADDT